MLLDHSSTHFILPRLSTPTSPLIPSTRTPLLSSLRPILPLPPLLLIHQTHLSLVFIILQPDEQRELIFFFFGVLGCMGLGGGRGGGG